MLKGYRASGHCNHFVVFETSARLAKLYRKQHAELGHHYSSGKPANTIIEANRLVCVI